MKKIALCLMLFSLGLFSVGCGGADDSTTTPDPAPADTGDEGAGADTGADGADTGADGADTGDTDPATE